jgi:DHA1 family tetracycline resistance protein-like MFS transporter
MQLRIRQKNLIPLTLILFIEVLTGWITLPVLYHVLMSPQSDMLNSDMDFSSRKMLYFLLILLSPFCKMLTALFISSLSDRYGRKSLLLFCFLIGVFGFTLMLFSVFWSSLSLLILSCIFHGISNSSIVVAKSAIADFSSSMHHVKYYGLLLCAYLFGFAIGPHLGSLLSNIAIVNWFDFTTPIWIALTLLLFNFVLLLEFYRDAEVTRLPRLSIIQLWQTSQQLWHTVSLRNLLLVVFLINLITAYYGLNHFIFLLHVLNFSAMQLGLLLTFTIIGAALSSAIIAPIISRKISLPTFLSRALIGLTIAYAFSLIAITWVQIVIILFIGIIIGLLSPVYTAMLASSYSDKQPGFIMGWLGIILSLAWLLGIILNSVLVKIPYYLNFAVAIIIMCYSIYLSIKHVKFKTQLERQSKL